MRSNQNKRSTNTISILLFSITILLSGNVFSAFTIGQTGPGGGIIFQVTRDGLHGLEVAKVDQSTAIQWHVYNGIDLNTMAVKSGLRDGGFNTDRIIITHGSENYAALLCANYNGGGYGDWYLPSKDELNLLYKNLHLKGLGGFTSLGNYWSSTELNTDQAWAQFFSGGNQFVMAKRGNEAHVRCVRAL